MKYFKKELTHRHRHSYQINWKQCQAKQSKAKQIKTICSVRIERFNEMLCSLDTRVDTL